MLIVFGARYLISGERAVRAEPLAGHPLAGLPQHPLAIDAPHHPRARRAGARAGEREPRWFAIELVGIERLQTPTR